MRPQTLYIEKDVENKFGDNRNCHIATNGSFNLNARVMPDGELSKRGANTGSIRFASFVDVDAYENGKAADAECITQISVDELNKIPEFEALFTRLAQVMIENAAQLKGGVLKLSALPTETE